MLATRRQRSGRAIVIAVTALLAASTFMTPAGATPGTDERSVKVTPSHLATAQPDRATPAIPAKPAVPPGRGTRPKDGANTADSAELHTWWHANHEFNTSTPTAPDAVRRSAFYDVTVATADDPSQRYDSFTYLSIPRSGKGKIGYTKEDGAEFADSADLTMSWSTFLYSTDVWVDVTLTTGDSITSADEVTIRPRHLDFETELVGDDTIRVKVPYHSDGYRFSVEFDPEMITAYNDMTGVSGKLTTESAGNRAIHTEPRNSLLIFAEPMLAGADRERLVPTPEAGSIHYPDPGEVTDLGETSADIIYFRPGTYSMGSKHHAVLPENVRWVYLAPGAYVKGAFRFFHDTQARYKVTGFGVLSGEQYVYEADTDNDYDHLSGASNCHATCVKMLQFASGPSQQRLDLHGITINEPPYHSFVVYGHEDRFSMRVQAYKQVGSWYWQTDGIELYRGSTMENTFFHANDDVLKMYHSDVTIQNTVIWKGENGPVIQWGWTPREIDGVAVRDTYVIHNRMSWKDVKFNTCVLNSSSHWMDMGSTTTADPTTTVQNMLFENIVVEGATNCAVRIYALSRTENIHIKDLAIDSWNDLDTDSQVSHLQRYSNAGGQQVAIGDEINEGRGIKLENYTVGGDVVTKDGDNWAADDLGRLGFDADLWDSWNAWASDDDPGDTDPGDGITSQIVNGHSGKCIDRSGGGTANGTHVQQWSCHDTPAMHWALAGGALRSGGKCLDLFGGGSANGTKAQLWDCGGWPSQEWIHQPDGTLLNPASGRCLDVEGGSDADGARLHLWDCGGWPSQQWTILE
jgi:hypothetical protein